MADKKCSVIVYISFPFLQCLNNMNRQQQYKQSLIGNYKSNITK